MTPAGKAARIAFHADLSHDWDAIARAAIEADPVASATLRFFEVWCKPGGDQSHELGLAERDVRLALGEERVWLIEWPADDNMPARWWHPSGGWMLDATKAIRFAREIDARAEIMGPRHQFIGGVGIRPTEHIFGLFSAPPERTPT